MPEFQIDLSPIADAGLDLEQYFGLWLVHDLRFGLMLDRISRMDLAAHVAANANRPVVNARVGMATADEIAISIIDIQGTMTKRGSSLSAAGSTVRLRQAIRAAANDSAIGGIVLRIDSPGGTMAGTADLAAEVAAASAKKPTWAFVEDVAGSAAYWVASQASKIVANNATAEVGSIGTFMALYDVSAAATMQGIKAVVIRTGHFKGAGFPGTEISQEQRDLWQEIVDKTQAEFTAGVAAGRKLSFEQVSTLADGRVWLASDAKENGLIDGIASFDAVLSDMAAEIQRRNSSNRRKKPMAEENNTPRAATYAELKAACPGADPAFICSQMEAGATVEAAAKAWTAELVSQRDKAAADAAAARAEAEEAKAKLARPGVQPLGGNDGKQADGADPVAAFQAAVAEKVKCGLTKSKATAAVVREQPDLHAAFVASQNK